jgi:hypothetical protein
MSAATDLLDEIRFELDEAESKAWASLARYKFQMFGYWAAIWVHLNRIGGFKRPNPWSGLVAKARERAVAELQLPASRIADLFAEPAEDDDPF